ncbi:hypothetical protein NQZ68_017654 [Dissostichus eleginoides]|nr:hypothetical protein NQZ68_017654 [Dissostichus eleginoides]
MDKRIPLAPQRCSQSIHLSPTLTPPKRAKPTGGGAYEPSVLRFGSAINKVLLFVPHSVLLQLDLQDSLGQGALRAARAPRGPEKKPGLRAEAD